MALGSEQRHASNKLRHKAGAAACLSGTGNGQGQPAVYPRVGGWESKRLTQTWNSTRRRKAITRAERSVRGIPGDRSGEVLHNRGGSLTARLPEQRLAFASRSTPLGAVRPAVAGASSHYLTQLRALARPQPACVHVRCDVEETRSQCGQPRGSRAARPAHWRTLI